MRILCLLFLFLVSCKGDNPSQVASEIINKFGATCSGNGRWAQQALSQTQALIQIIESLKTKDQCKKFGSFLDHLLQTTRQIHGAYQDTTFLDYRQTQEELQELFLSLQKAEQLQDADLVAQLKVEILSRQALLASLRAQHTVYKEGLDRVGFQDQFSVTTENVASYFATLFNQSGELAACLQQSPSSVIGLFSSLASVGGSFASPVLGSHLQVLSGMFNTFLNYMRYANLEQIKWELYASQMPQAIGCALESMTNFYCQAADAAQMVNIQAKSYQPGERPQNFWRGIDLLTRQLPVFNNWLLKVRAGVKPQRSVDAYQQKRVLEKRLKLDTRDLQVQGRINEDARKLRGSNDPRIKKDIMFQLIYDLSVELSGESQRKMMGGVGPDPFSDLSKDPRRFACWLLQGVKNPCPEPAEARETLEDYIKKRLNLNVPLREVQYENWPQILARATKQVLLEFSDIILVNSDLLIAAAHERSTRFVSPKEALEMIRSFVQDMLEKSSKNAEHANRKKPLKDTLEMIDQVLKIMNRAYAGEGLYLHTVFPWFVRGMGDDIGKTIGEDDEEINPLSVIYLLLRLDLGVQYFSERLTEFVEWDMVDKIQSGEIPQNIKEILQGVGGEIVRRLSEAGMEGDLLTVKRDLDVAMDQTEINFQIFRELMIDKTDQIPEIIEKLYQRAKEGETGQEGFRGIRYQRLAHFCLMVYISGGWPDNKSKEICRQLTLYGPYADSHPDGKIQLGQLEKALNQIRDPLERRRKRICTYYDFRRKNRIFEILENPTTAL